MVHSCPVWIECRILVFLTDDASCPQRPCLPGRKCAGSESMDIPIRRQNSSDMQSGSCLLRTSATADRRRVLITPLPTAICVAETPYTRCPESVVGYGNLMAKRIRREHTRSRIVSAIQGGSAARRTSSMMSLRLSLLPRANSLLCKKMSSLRRGTPEMHVERG